MDRHMDGQAPWSRLQRQAIFGLPMALLAGAIIGGRALFGPTPLPVWAQAAIGLLVAGCLLGMIVAPRFAEAIDERDRRIMLKATRAAFGVLLLGILLTGTARNMVMDGPPPWDAERLAMSMAMLAMAVYFAAILLLYRRRTDD